MTQIAPSARAINEWLDHWVHPRNLNGEPLQLNRARTQAAVCWLGCGAFAVAALVQLLRPELFEPQTLSMQLAGLTCSAALLGLGRAFHRVDVTGQVIVLLAFAFMVVPVLANGDPTTPAMFWTPVISLMAFALLGRAPAVAWLSLTGVFAAWMLFLGGPAGHAAGIHDGRLPAAGHLVGISALVFVITAVWDRSQQATIADLALARDQAKAADRAKSAVVAIVSHELRTPMNGVLGMLELLAETGLDKDQRAFTETARSSATGLLSILEDLLDMSRIEAGQLELRPESFNLPSMFQEIEAMFRLGRGPESVKVELQLLGNVPQNVIGDPRRIRQVVTNLVGNALKFTHEGYVRIRVDGHDAGPEQARLSVWVEDSGIGISPERLPHVFKPFTQADDTIGDRYGGTGLGLAISHQLVQLMGGTIDVRSIEGQGTTFRFDLPLVKAPPPSLEELGPGFRLVGYTGSVLVAEDQPVNQLVIDRYLARFKIKARFVEDGIAAVQATREQDWDLVLMDCEMPVMDGFTATSNLRTSGNHTPVVALTAHASPEIRQRCKEAGMDGFLTKPIDRAALRDVLDRWLDPLTEEITGKDQGKRSTR